MAPPDDGRPKGRAPTGAEWGIIQKAPAEGAAQAARARDLLAGVQRFLLAGSGDPRRLAPDVERAVNLFTGHFKSTRPGDVQEILDGFKLATTTLGGLERSSFVVVTNDMADRDGKLNGDADPQVLAFVMGREPIVYLADRFFHGHLPETKADLERDVTGLEQGAPGPETGPAASPAAGRGAHPAA